MNEHSQETQKSSGNRRLREKAQRRESILVAAERVFATNGYHEASIQRIAQEAELAAGTIYLYFKDKESLYSALITTKIIEMVNQVEQCSTETQDPLEALRRAILVQFEFHDRNREFFQLMLQHRPAPDETSEDQKLILKTVRRHQAILSDLIGNAQKLGKFRSGDVHLLAVALLGMMFHVTKNFMQAASSPPPAEQATFTYDLFLRGIHINP